MKLFAYIQEKEKKALSLGLEKEAIRKLLIDIKYQNIFGLISNFDNELSKEDEEELNILLDRYFINKEPIQYIVGFSYFFNGKFKVNKNVLIPRPETEILCEIAKKEIAYYHYKTVLDIGTGSGAIAVSVYEENLDVTAVDISSSALEVAKENAKENNAKVEFIVSDLFSSLQGKKFDLILSNPPYIEENAILEDCVIKHEPHLALFGGKDGLDYYRRIIKDSKEYINENGMIIFEIGSTQGKEVTTLALQVYKNAEVQIVKDYQGLDRIVIIKVGVING